MTKALESALDELLLACAASADDEIKALAERVKTERKQRGRGQPKATLPTPEEVTLPGSAEAFIAWQCMPARLGEYKTVWSENQVCRQLSESYDVSINTVRPLVRAIQERLAPPKTLPFSITEQMVVAQKSVKK